MECLFKKAVSGVLLPAPAVPIELGELFTTSFLGLEDAGIQVHPCFAKVYLNHVIVYTARMVRTGTDYGQAVQAPNLLYFSDEQWVLARPHVDALVNGLVQQLRVPVSNLLTRGPNAAAAYDLKISETYILRLLSNPQG